MAVGFGDPDADGVLFSVFPDDEGNLPMPTGPDNENGPRIYSAELRIQSADDLADLKALKSLVTISPAMGFVTGGTLVVEAGPGSRELVYPHADLNEASIDAILTHIEPIARMTADEYRVSVSFVVVDD